MRIIMNRDTQLIIRLFGGCAEDIACCIQARMGENGLDFSECTNKQFNQAAIQAARELYGESFARSL